MRRAIGQLASDPITQMPGENKVKDESTKNITAYDLRATGITWRTLRGVASDAFAPKARVLEEPISMRVLQRSLWSIPNGTFSVMKLPGVVGTRVICNSAELVTLAAPSILLKHGSAAN